MALASKLSKIFSILFRFLVNNEEFLDEIFCIAFRKIFRIFPIEFLSIIFHL